MAGTETAKTDNTARIGFIPILSLIMAGPHPPMMHNAQMHRGFRVQQTLGNSAGYARPSRRLFRRYAAKVSSKEYPAERTVRIGSFSPGALSALRRRPTWT